jgi:hypothetical protein
MSGRNLKGVGKGRVELFRQTWSVGVYACPRSRVCTKGRPLAKKVGSGSAQRLTGAVEPIVDRTNHFAPGVKELRPGLRVVAPERNGAPADQREFVMIAGLPHTATRYIGDVVPPRQLGLAQQLEDLDHVDCWRSKGEASAQGASSVALRVSGVTFFKSVGEPIRALLQRSKGPCTCRGWP